MDWINYHHLLYFWMVARTGSIAKAAEELLLAPPTISAQIKSLEQALGEPLLRRVGRGVELTEVGRTVYAYADEIFALGREMVDTLRQRPTPRGTRIRVGIVDAVPKLVARRLLEPAFTLGEPVHLVAREAKAEELEHALAEFRLDLVISDAPVPARVRVRAHNHALGTSGVTLFAAADLRTRLEGGFPAMLHRAPMLLPTENNAMRPQLDAWFRERGIEPSIVAEFEDTALLKVFGQGGRGIFPAPSVIADEVESQYGVRRLGVAEGVEERFYAITVDRKIRNPAAVAICEAARARVFRTEPERSEGEPEAATADGPPRARPRRSRG